MSSPSPTAAPSPGPTPPPPFKIYQPGERPDENRGYELMATCVTLTVLADAIVCLRLYVKRSFVRIIGVDDHLMVLAAIVLTAMTGIIIAEVRLGAGRHIEYISPEDYKEATHLNYATQPTCLIALTFARLSVCYFLLRFAPSRRYKWFLWFLIGLNIVLVVVFAAQTIFQCWPIEYIWNKDLPGGGGCMPVHILVGGGLVNSSLTAVSDFCLAALPIPMLWNLQMNWRVKTAVMAILSLGFFTVVAAIMKTIALRKWGEKGDYMWDSASITLWYTAEIAVAIIAGSIPCLKPLFTGLLASTGRYGSAGGAKTATPRVYAIAGSSSGQGGGVVGSRGRKSAILGIITLSGEDDEDGFELNKGASRSSGGGSGGGGGGGFHHHSAGGGGMPVMPVSTSTVTAAERRRPSDDERSRSPKITRTTDITVSVEDAPAKSAKYTV